MRPTSKKGRLVRNLAIHVKLGMAATSSRLSKGSPAFTKWNLLRVLAMGVMMSVGAAMYFNLASEGAVGAPTTKLDTGARPTNGDARYIRTLNNDDEWQFDSPYYDNFQSISAPPLSKEALAVYQRDDDEWLYRSPFRRNWDDFSFGEGAGSSSISTIKRVQVLREDDPYAHLTLEPFDQAVTTKDAPNYHQQRVADSLEERMEAQRVWQKILGE